MTLMTCSECGRAVSDQATACVGCGAPLHKSTDLGAFNLVPDERPVDPPTSRQLRWRAVLASAALAIGVIWAGTAEQGPHRNRISTVIAALLLIGGLCGLLVTLIQGFALRNRPGTRK